MGLRNEADEWINIKLTLSVSGIRGLGLGRIESEALETERERDKERDTDRH
jgi:hypothetical protein